jgi:hypothetical protein
MASEERIAELADYVKDWEEMYANVCAKRDKLFVLKGKGAAISNDAGEDVLQRMIEDADSAARQLQRVVTQAQSLLGRAQAGEDV